MTEARDALQDRIRMMLGDLEGVREQPMFGLKGMLLNDRFLAGAQKSGGLLLRVDKERHEEILLLDGATQATMGPASRSMGRGWVEIEPDALAEDEALSDWLDLALECVARLDE